MKNLYSSLSKLSIFLLTLLFFSPAYAEKCSITLGGDGRSRTETTESSKDFHHIGGRWEFIRSTSGPCIFKVYNKDQLQQGRSNVYGSNITGRIRIGAKGAQNKGGWKARSLSIVKIKNPSCSITLGDNGVRQTFYGPSKTDNLTGWSFVTRTIGNCSFSTYNQTKLSGNVKNFRGGLTERNRVGYRIRSVSIK